MRLRENPFPEERPACLDDLVFLPANLSRLVIDPYREACKISWSLGERLALDIPFFVAGFDEANEELSERLALGGEITHTGMRFAPDRNEEERAGAVVNILKANAGEASMMARCAGKTRLHNIEPEDLRSVTRATAAATGIPLAGTRAAQGAHCTTSRLPVPSHGTHPDSSCRGFNPGCGRRPPPLSPPPHVASGPASPTAGCAGGRLPDKRHRKRSIHAVV